MQGWRVAGGILLPQAATLTSWIRKALGHRLSASKWSQISERMDAAGDVFHSWIKGHSGLGSFSQLYSWPCFPQENLHLPQGKFSQYAFTLCIGKHATVNFLSCTGMTILISPKPNQKSTGSVSRTCDLNCETPTSAILNTWTWVAEWSNGNENRVDLERGTLSTGHRTKLSKCPYGWRLRDMLLVLSFNPKNTMI